MCAFSCTAFSQEQVAFILMHDDYATSVEAALKIVDQLQEEGYEFVTVDELILE